MCDLGCITLLWEQVCVPGADLKQGLKRCLQDAGQEPYHRHPAPQVERAGQASEAVRPHSKPEQSRCTGGHCMSRLF
jgi:hypothetical protein